MVGLQFGAVMEIWVRCSTASSTTIHGSRNRACITTGPKRSSKPTRNGPWKQGCDPLGYYLAPFGYERALVEQAIQGDGVRSIRRPSQILSDNEHKTIVGPIAFSADGGAGKPRCCRPSSAVSWTKNIEQIPQLRQAGDSVPGQAEIWRSRQSL